VTKIFASLSALLLAAWVAVAPSAPAAAAAGASTPVPPTASRALSDLGGCIASNDALLVKFVVDESKSLRETDPDDLRSDALATAFDALAAGAGDKRVEASVSTFAVDVVERVGWGPVDGRHLTRLHDLAAGSAELDGGSGTDYRTGLDRARGDLRARAAELAAEGVTTCQALLFFTDGGLDVDDTTGNVAAERELCTPGGIADALRRQGATVIALSLLPEGTGKGAADGRALLQAVAEGRAGATTCGTHPIAPEAALGAYLPVSGASSLAAMFAEAMARAEGYGGGHATSCPDQGCRLEIPVDAGVDSVLLLARATGDVPALSLTLPNGTTVDVPATGAVDQAGIAGGWRGPLAQLAGDVREAGPGSWQLTVDGGAADVQALYLTRFSVAPADASAFARAGETTPVRLRLTRADGQPVVADDYQQLSVAAQTGDGEPRPLVADGEDWLVDVPVPRAGFPTEIPLGVSVDAVSAPSGLELPPVTNRLRIPVRPPQSFPVVESSALEFDVSGTEPATAALRIRGSDDGPTSVRVDSVAVSGPSTAGMLHVDHPAEPVMLAAGEEQQVPIVLAAEHAADGTGDGTATVTLQGANGEQTTMTVPVHVSLVRPVNEAVRWPLVVLLTALSVLVPYVLMLLFSRRSARFQNTGTARVYVVPVAVTPTGIQSRDPSDPTLVDADRHGAAVRPSQPRSRRLTVPAAPGLALSAGPRAWPPHLVQPRAVATAPSPGRIAAVDLARSSVSGPRDSVPVSLGLADTALVVVGTGVGDERDHDPSSPDRPVPATLVLFRLDPELEPFDSWRQHVTLALRTLPDWRVLYEALSAPGAPAGERAPRGSPPPPRTPASVSAGPSLDLDSGTGHRDGAGPPPPTW
jgi:hypothetical protein